MTLNYYRDNASHNGYFELSNGLDSFKSMKQDWIKMVQVMMKDYMEGYITCQQTREKFLTAFKSFCGKKGQ